jgi:NADH:ubiquinone oxidoreductase subunit
LCCIGLSCSYYELDLEDVVYGRDRVVWYSNPQFDASQVPPEWHQWLHRMTDKLPTRDTTEEFTPKYAKEHSPNLTGTDKAYSPKNYIGNEEWDGHAKGPIRAWVPTSSASVSRHIVNKDDL